MANKTIAAGSLERVCGGIYRPAKTTYNLPIGASVADRSAMNIGHTRGTTILVHNADGVLECGYTNLR
jgi:hypothetical protein